MANGAYHYEQAEGGIEYALDFEEDHSHEDVMRILAVAQVHATLALAAATAQNILRNGAVETSADGWREVLL